MSQADLGGQGLFLLALASSISTLAALMVFRRFSDGASIRTAANRILAHLMELGLFFDDPALVLRAQGDLLRENLKVLRLIAVPCALLALPFAILFMELNAVFARTPLAAGAPAVVTLRWTGPSPVASPVLEAPEGIEVETPGVRMVFSHEVVWRIRPMQSVRGRLKIALADRVLAVPVFAGPGLMYAFPFPAASIRVNYPRATILHLDWILWYILASAVTALAWRASQA